MLVGGMDLTVRQGQADKERKLPSSMPLYRLPGEAVTQIRGESSFLNTQIQDRYLLDSRSGLEVELPMSD